MDRPVLIAGVPGSPYTRKMRALLRYRQIPHRFIPAYDPAVQNLPQRPLPLIPCIWLPEGTDDWRPTSDSTFQIRTLDELFAGRSTRPADPALRLLDDLVEDYADEWVTKQMFYYRWGIEENVDHACNMLPLWNVGATDAMVEQFRPTFGQRQIDRLSGIVTGDLEICGPIIADSYERLLAILRDHLAVHNFVLGSRPSSGDFALFGQLTQLVQVEPTSIDAARRIAPRVMAWVDVVEDLSGFSIDDEGGWLGRGDLGDTFASLLSEIGRTYAPFLVANAQAVDAGEDTMRCEIEGRTYWQKPFAYQRKCLGWLRDAYAELEAADRSFVDEMLAGTGCETIFA